MTPERLGLRSVLPILLTEHGARAEAKAALGIHPLDRYPMSSYRDDLPWLWVGGVPRLVPGVAAAWVKAESYAAGVSRAADLTERWLSVLAELPESGVRIDDGAFHALTNTGTAPRRKAWRPPTMSRDGASSGLPARPENERVRARALAAAMAGSAGPSGGGDTYPAILMSGPLARLLDDLRRDREAVAAVLTPESETIRALVRVEDRLARALGEASELEGLVSTDDAARIERVSADTVKKRCQRGHYLNARKRGGLWFIPITSLTAAREER